jgi:hypothetical protein
LRAGAAGKRLILHVVNIGDAKASVSSMAVEGYRGPIPDREDSMKNGLKSIIGKEIAAVVVATGDRAPRQQVFLVFSDGTRFEFWGDEFSCRSRLDPAVGIEEYVESGAGRIHRVYGDVEQLAPTRDAQALALDDDSSLERALRRDLHAWHEAQAAIYKARARS